MATDDSQPDRTPRSEGPDESASSRPAADWIAAIYDQVYAIAERALRGERDDHTLNPTALVNEAFLRLAEHRQGFADDDAFRAAVAVTMRRVLVDHARRRDRQKRRAGAAAVRLPDDLASLECGSIEQYAAIERLARHSERLAAAAAAASKNHASEGLLSRRAADRHARSSRTG